MRAYLVSRVSSNLFDLLPPDSSKTEVEAEAEVEVEVEAQLVN